MWKLINQLLDRFQIRIWKVIVNQYKMKTQFFFLFLFWLCVCVKSFGLLVTKINNKKTSKIFQFRPTKEEKFKLMTPWFIRVFFFGSLFLMFNLLRVIFFYNKVLSPTFSEKVCMGRIGQVESNIFNQPANDKLEKFQSAANPPIYKSSGSVENLNGFNLAG